MRILLLIAALVALPLGWLAVIWLLVRDRTPAPLTGIAVGDRLNIALFVLTIVSSVVALVAVAAAVMSYRQAAAVTQWQLEAGTQQSKALASQAEALIAARDALATMVRASEKGQQALEAQIELAHQQKAAEEARRPRIEIDFGNTSWATLRQLLERKNRIALTRQELKAAQTRFTIRNVGNATLLHPVIVLSASDPAIRVSPRQFSGGSVQDIIPYAAIGRDYTYETTISVPSAVGSFELRFQVSGDNMPPRQLTLPIVIVES